MKVQETLSDSQTVSLLKLIEDLQQDLRNLGSETRRKFPQIKEASENNIKKLREITKSASDVRESLLTNNTEMVRPFLLGCNTKVSKAVILSLSGLQKMVTHQILTEETAAAVVGTLWGLMETGVEELRLLQTTILLITTNAVVKDKHLAKALVMCFRLHFTKNSATINTAAATVRQCASAIYERVLWEDADSGHQPEEHESPSLCTSDESGDMEPLKLGSNKAPASLRPCARDGFMLFQDLCLLVNAEPPIWLQGLTEMTRTLGLEILETVLSTYPTIFQKHKEFTFLLKERVCPLVIKLFSPSLKFKPGLSTNPNSTDKPSFPMVLRLIRLITIIIKNYFYLLNTECEIFLSLLIRFLDMEKPLWQRGLALEVLYKFVSQPHLVKHICESFDMKEHSTKIFRELVNSISSFIQSSFIGQSSGSNQSVSKDVSGVPPALVGGMPVGPGVSPQSAFVYKGTTIPLHMSPKIIFFEMLEKTEAPLPPDGYCVSLGFLCLVEVVRSVGLLVDGPGPGLAPPDAPCKEELVAAAWCGALAALSLLLETSTDESAIESILKAKQTMVSACGTLGLTTPRDAFVTALCKGALPNNYALAVLSHAAVGQQKGQFLGQGEDAMGSNNAADQSQVVVVGSGLPIAGLSTALGPIMLTTKNLQCMRAVLGVAHLHGAVLGTAWHLLLTTLQHLVWILGIKVTQSGSGSTESTGGSVVTTSVMSDLPVLTAMLARLFESSQQLDEVALHHLIDALCKLSSEAMEIAYANKEPSLFPVAKLMETGLVNTGRLEIWWRPVYAHLLEVCQHSHQGLRQLGADALVALIKEAIKYQFQPPFWENAKINSLVLHPLSELSQVKQADVCQKQLDCVQHILHTCGGQVAGAWLRIIRIIGAISDASSEQLIRNAFQCLQLVISDYLSALETACYPILVEVAAKFAHQKHDLNIALTAIGSIWHITDYFFQESAQLRKTLSTEELDELWICVYCRLADLCVDPRPAVRKSSGQTLFNTIDSHGGLLQKPTWKTVLWKVLFPLVESVSEQCAVAPEERSDPGGLLMHHSRDTAAKQWAETHVLTLSGLAHVFTRKQTDLLQLDDFLRAWKLLLECIESSALSPNAEISVNALRSFQEVLSIESALKPDEEPYWDVWSMSWQSWLRIGLDVTSGVGTPAGTPSGKMVGTQSKDRVQHVPQQAFLSLLLDIFPRLFSPLVTRFSGHDLVQLCRVTRQSLVVPARNGDGPTLLPLSYQETSLTPLQEAALACLNRVAKEVLSGPDNLRSLLAAFFAHLLGFANFAVQFPKSGSNGKTDCVPMSFVTFGEKCLEVTTDLYQECADLSLVISNDVLNQILQTLHRPLSMKYSCPSQSTWKLASQCLINVLIIGVPVAKKNTHASKAMWSTLADTLQDFLFSKQKILPGLSVEEFQHHEALDCRLIHLIRDQFLTDSTGIPDTFIDRMVTLLNTGSIHSASSNNLADLESSRAFREELAQLCFETLVQFSMAGGQGPVSKAAVRSILQRCSCVLAQYVQDERISGRCPLPRARLSEVGFVLKAMATLLVTFKKAPDGQIDKEVWELVIEVYPHAVDCVTVSGAQFLKPLRDLLHEYRDLLKPAIHKH